MGPTLAALGLILGLSACGDAQQSEAKAGATGTVRARLVDLDPERVASVKLEVYRGDNLVESATITPAPIRLPDGVEASQMGGDAFFVLRPGDYRVVATPLGPDGGPAGDCVGAESTAHVVPGETTEIMLSLFCSDPGTGGLDVIVGVDYQPTIVDLDIAPSKLTRTCQPVTVTVQAVDPDGDPLTYTWVVDTGDAGTYTLTPDGNTAVFVAETAATYQLKVSVSDPAGHAASLRFPIHVGPGDVTACLDTPEGWTCSPAFYGNGEGCDCGCGVLDPDCADATAAACDFNNCPFPQQPRADNNAVCIAPVCGDGVVDPGEECDPADGITCSHDCQRLPVCGDGHIDEPETCEPPASAFCDNSCQIIPGVCGNGLVEEGEACDPPDGVNCSDDCQHLDP